MTRTDRRFARFYFDDFIRDYPDIYADDAAFATWTRLLVLVERAWPAMAELPRSVRSAPLRKLVARGLIAVGPDHIFAVKGFHFERERRHANAAAAAHAKWDANGHAAAPANGHAAGMPSTKRVRREGLNEARTDRKRAGGRLVQPSEERSA